MDKTRVSYPKELKAQAKSLSLGLATISVTTPDGERTEGQAALTPLQCKFARWAAAMLFTSESRELPDLEAIFISLLEKHPC